MTQTEAAFQINEPGPFLLETTSSHTDGILRDPSLALFQAVCEHCSALSTVSTGGFLYIQLNTQCPRIIQA